MTKQRTCDACGGTGENYSAAFDRDDCPACSGRGWQSDAMPVSDALADAETLRKMVSAWDKRGYALPSSRVSPILQAGKYGADASFFMRHLHAPADEPGQFAITAARAAFRAVPGLRG